MRIKIQYHNRYLREDIWGDEIPDDIFHKLKIGSKLYAKITPDDTYRSHEIFNWYRLSDYKLSPRANSDRISFTVRRIHDTGNHEQSYIELTDKNWYCDEWYQACGLLRKSSGWDYWLDIPDEIYRRPFGGDFRKMLLATTCWEWLVLLKMQVSRNNKWFNPATPISENPVDRDQRLWFLSTLLLQEISLIESIWKIISPNKSTEQCFYDWFKAVMVHLLSDGIIHKFETDEEVVRNIGNMLYAIRCGMVHMGISVPLVDSWYWTDMDWNITDSYVKIRTRLLRAANAKNKNIDEIIFEQDWWLSSRFFSDLLNAIETVFVEQLIIQST